MTNDIKDIRNKYLKENNTVHNDLSKFPIGSEVRDIKNNQILIIKDFDSALNKYSCYTKEGLFIGRFCDYELTS